MVLSSFPADSAKPVPLAVVSLDSRWDSGNLVNSFVPSTPSPFLSRVLILNNEEEGRRLEKSMILEVLDRGFENSLEETQNKIDEMDL